MSDLPNSKYHIKIYTNAKGYKYDDIIAFHSSIEPFSLNIGNKSLEFERDNVDGIGTLKLTVNTVE